jgi:toxin ParE1/3/4
MGRKVVRTPRARLDLIEIWQFIADDNETAADRLLDRMDEALAMLGDNPHAGRARPELAVDLRSFPIGNYVLFYRPMKDGGIELIRVRSGYLDIRPEDMD